MPIILTFYTAILILAVWQDTHGTNVRDAVEVKAEVTAEC